MSILDRLRPNGHAALRESGNGSAALTEERAGQLLDTLELFQERIAELELALEDAGWQRVGGESGREFSREALRRIAALSRLNYLKNPLVNRGVSLQAFYVFGQGVNISARHPEVQEVVQAFLDDPKNRAELTGHQARILKEVDLQVEGNLFFVCFADASSGRVRLRTIPPDEVVEIVTDPEDAKSPWFYKRTWTERRVDPATGVPEHRADTAYYPDWRHRPKQGDRRPKIGGAAVQWDTPVYHVMVGGLSDMRFGVPETYAALDWARAYKTFLEDVATLMRAYSRFAGKLTVGGGKAGVAAAKAKVGTTLGAGGTGQAETNPPAVTGSMFIGARGQVDYQPLQLRGASVDPEDGRRLLLMVAAAFGYPETFFGDVNTGNLATAKSLDRPTELKFRDRQTLWTDVLRDLLGYVIDRSAVAPKGRLQGKIEDDEFGEERVVLAPDAETGEPMDRGLDISFPPILEHDVSESVDAVAKAATLGAPGTFAGTLDPKTTTRLLLQALGEDDIDELLGTLFPDGSEAEEEPEAEAGVDQAEVMRIVLNVERLERLGMPEQAERLRRKVAGLIGGDVPPTETPALPAAEALMLEAVRELRDAIRAETRGG